MSNSDIQQAVDLLCRIQTLRAEMAELRSQTSPDIDVFYKVMKEAIDVGAELQQATQQLEKEKTEAKASEENILERVREELVDNELYEIRLTMVAKNQDDAIDSVVYAARYGIPIIAAVKKVDQETEDLLCIKRLVDDPNSGYEGVIFSADAEVQNDESSENPAEILAELAELFAS